MVVEEDLPTMKSKKEKAEMKKAEKEELEEENARMLAAVAFAVVLIGIGLPLWWKTTQVYRVALPYNKIDALRPQEEKGLSLKITVLTIEEPRGTQLCADFDTVFRLSKLFRVKCESRGLNSAEKARIGNVQRLHDLDRVELIPVALGDILLVEVPGISRLTQNLVVLGSKRAAFFSSETGSKKLIMVLNEWLLREETITQTLKAMRAPTLAGKGKEARTRVPPTVGNLDILLSLAVPSPEEIRVDWDITAAIEDYLQPFLDEMSSVSNFSVKSQVTYFASLGVRKKAVNTKELGPHYAIQEELLPQIISPLEKKIGSHVSTSASLCLVLYIPGCTEAPLHFYTKQGQPVPTNAIISARWGGLIVLNPPNYACKSDEVIDMDVPTLKVMGLFLAQLRQLLGIPELEPIHFAEMLPLMEAEPRLWEIDSLMRTRALEQVTSATLTLQSLAKLLGQIGNIVIGDEVGRSIFVATESAHSAEQLLSEGKLKEGFDHSRVAFLESESAFTDPSLLALLYFPDDQKYAVYIPLFLPVMIPVLMSLKTIKNWVLKKLSQGKHKRD
ncbi:GPI transamidase component PIG-S [Neocloeon triangulifer]|uniref:GPI transamidase component PIG-S n=1 Tax=Neocloeon triangulifer TaxID=2078957 RepID=UPI00286EC7BD|nr:GPI transamidase component PIG-S [Neocloeon triangulifer]